MILPLYFNEKNCGALNLTAAFCFENRTSKKPSVKLGDLFISSFGQFLKMLGVCRTQIGRSKEFDNRCMSLPVDDYFIFGALKCFGDSHRRSINVSRFHGMIIFN